MSNKVNIAILSTPRVGNTWVSFSLAHLYGAEQLAVHNFTDLSHIKIPRKVVLQLHDSPSNKKLANYLLDNDYKVITVARHPLDVLISILHFTQVRTDPVQWLDGAAHIEDLRGLDPSSEKFIEWCLGDNASRVLAITYEWACSGKARVVRYEDLLENPIESFKDAVSYVGGKTDSSKIIQTIEKFDINFFRKANKHGWKAKKGNWINFFTINDAQSIYNRHKDIFELFDYDVSSAQNVRREQNLDRWDIKEHRQIGKASYLKEAIHELETNNRIVRQENIYLNSRHAIMLAKLQASRSVLERANTELEGVKRIIDSQADSPRYLLKQLLRSINRKVLCFIENTKKTPQATHRIVQNETQDLLEYDMSILYENNYSAVKHLGMFNMLLVKSHRATLVVTKTIIKVPVSIHSALRRKRAS